jgi:hypothetical protein
VRHNSQAFQFTRPFALTAIGNTIAFSNREQLGLDRDQFRGQFAPECRLTQRRRIVSCVIGGVSHS